MAARKQATTKTAAPKKTRATASTPAVVTEQVVQEPSLPTAPATPEAEAAPIQAVETVSDARALKVQAVLALMAEGPAAIADAIRTGRLSLKLPRQPRQFGRPQNRHQDLSPEQRAMVIKARNEGKSYVDLDKMLGFEDAVATRGHVSWIVCKAARAAGLQVRQSRSPGDCTYSAPGFLSPQRCLFKRLPHNYSFSPGPQGPHYLHLSHPARRDHTPLPQPLGPLPHARECALDGLQLPTHATRQS